MKRMMAYMLAGVLTLGCGTTAFGAEKISSTMMVQDKEVTQTLYADEWGTKLVPVREVGDILGYTVAWDKTTRSVTLSDGTTTVGFASRQGRVSGRRRNKEHRLCAGTAGGRAVCACGSVFRFLPCGHADKGRTACFHRPDSGRRGTDYRHRCGSGTV